MFLLSESIFAYVPSSSELNTASAMHTLPNILSQSNIFIFIRLVMEFFIVMTQLDSIWRENSSTSFADIFIRESSLSSQRKTPLQSGAFCIAVMNDASFAASLTLTRLSRDSAFKSFLWHTSSAVRFILRAETSAS